MSGLLDQTTQIRKGEELDLATLEPYLRAELGLPDGDFALEQFPGGHSNLTYMARIGDREIVLRRPPYGSQVKGAHDMGREYTILSCIHDAYAPAPEPLFYCEDESVLGAKFYGMERINGVIFRTEKPEGLELNEELVRGLCTSVVHNLADLHAIDWKAAGLEQLKKPGTNFVERQVLGWARRWESSKTEEMEDVDTVFNWCKERIPVDTDATLIHNDYKFDNMILDSNDITRIVGVLDWEMSTIGDPVFDLGVTLGYWIDPGEPEGISTSRCFVQREPGAITRQEYAEIYAAKTGRDISNLHYYYAFAIIKLAVVIQQIYYRYATGKTTDERFAGMIDGVRLLARRAAQVVESETY
ncbi:MAG: phosphotransferase family protein [Candidatus Hydrogenedentes bacterium]|nr:phosphotransferase family protein [Candidatus Hydrogenedentota bacterium]